MPEMFHEDILKWMKDKKKMVKFIKKVLNVARECPDQTSEKRTTSSNSSRAPMNVNDEDDDPDNIGKWQVMTSVPWFHWPIKNILQNM